MTRYFFNTQTDLRTTDDTGLDLASDAAARAEAIVTCGEMMRDAPEGFWSSRPWLVTVTDHRGLILYEISVDGFASPAARD